MMRLCFLIYEWSKFFSKILQDFVIYAVSLKKNLFFKIKFLCFFKFRILIDKI